MKKVIINSICLVMLGTFYTCSGSQAETPEDGANLLFEDDSDSQLKYKHPNDATTVIATVGVLARSFANNGAAVAALGVNQLWFNSTSGAISITQ